MSEYVTHSPVKRLERSSESRIIAGVCGGLGRYFDLSPAVFRLGLVVLTILGGAGILVYIAAVLVIPAEGKSDSFAAEVLANRRDHPARLIGLGLVAVALVVLLSRAAFWPAAGAGWVLVLIAGLLILWSSRRRGLVVALVGILAVLLATAVVAIVSAFAWFNVSLGDGVGKRTYIPTQVADVHSTYALGVGNLLVDLSHVRPNEPVYLTAKVGLGKLRVIVPQNVAVRVDASAKVGDIWVFSQHDDGTHAAISTGGGNGFTIYAKVGAGRVDVVRAG
jgi:phage shock protein PspC (stress-responsive transcriptional regulator)/predicted membrane protein